MLQNTHVLGWCVPASIVAVAFLSGGIAEAQVLHQELQETVRAEVLEIVREAEEPILGTETSRTVQEVRIEIREGEREGVVATFENDLVPLQVGESIYVNRLVDIDGVEYFSFKDVDRRGSLIAFGVLFAATVLLFSGMHGLRALLSLALSVVVILTVLVPLLLAGYSPVVVSVTVATVLLAVVIFLTHGRNARSVIALGGTVGAVVCTSILAAAASSLAHFTGLSSDESIFLNFSTKGSLDFAGLLLGSIIIGVLGVLDDVAITQASVVAELRRANALLSLRELYFRALRVGRDHVGSLVNTLAFAYLGAALPLVLLLAAAGSDIVLSLNQEMVAVELIRIFVGTIGLVLAVPLTTGIAAWWYSTRPVDTTGETGDHSTTSHVHNHAHAVKH